MAELAQVLRHLTPIEDPKALVDASTGDDAAVYLLDDGRALVVTLDFFTPLVDDPYDFGRIAAANALSDLYAMGAKPLFALNLLGFPRDLLGEGLAEEVIRGGAEIGRIAGIPIMGGHSVDDPEPKYGMVAIGEATQEALVTNTRARPGDRLILTKPLGTGIIATAIKAGEAPQAVIDAAVESMTKLNRAASECMVDAGVEAATDVTGFGLLGHLHNLLAQSGVAARIDASAVPVLDGARELASAGHVPGGSLRNLEDVSAHVDFGDLDDIGRLVLTDAQTSGGLLMAVNPQVLAELLDHLAAKDVPAAVVGEVVEGTAGRIEVAG
ncbi:MAG: selenide, water dikinase SelD [Gemmatimonadota bacterium]|nr:MAG: selenide, water dikinase SelD [Gemmatimonadota bacterium]